MRATRAKIDTTELSATNVGRNPSNRNGSSLSLSSLVAATERDHTRLIKKIKLEKECNIENSTPFVKVELDDQNKVSNFQKNSSLEVSHLTQVVEKEEFTKSHVNYTTAENISSNDIVLCGLCAKLFSSSDECNHHIFVVS